MFNVRQVTYFYFQRAQLLGSRLERRIRRFIPRRKQ